jgi:hypothetical protein
MTQKKPKISKRVHPQQSIAPYNIYIYIHIGMINNIYTEHNCTYTYAYTYIHTTHTL